MKLKNWILGIVITFIILFLMDFPLRFFDETPMNSLDLFIIIAATFGMVLFTSFSPKGMIVGLAIFADLGVLGVIMSGAWPLLFLLGIPVAILNYWVYFNFINK